MLITSVVLRPVFLPFCPKTASYGHLFIEINEVQLNILGTMAGRLLFSSLRQVQKLQKACVHGRSRIGNREVVGFGFNGQCSYQDRVDFPMPAIRFKENTPDLVVSTNILSIECISLRINFCLCSPRIM